MIRQRLIFMSAQASYKKSIDSMGETLVNHVAECELAADVLPGLSDSELEEYFLDNVSYFYNR